MRLTLLKFRNPLVVAFGTGMLSVVIAGAIEYWGMVRLDHIADGVRHGDAALALSAEDMREDVLELRRYEKDIFMNIGTDALVQQYRAKWDHTFVRLRYDLFRARAASSTSQETLQQVTDWIAAYREDFSRIYDSISNGTIRTTRQANDEMSRFKGPVRSAEQVLVVISDNARERELTLAPAVVAQRLGLGLSFVLLFALTGLFVRNRRHLFSIGYT